MIDEWAKFKGWVVLEHFLLYPNTRIYVNELSRRLKIGTFTAHRFCNSYADDGLLKKTKHGNSILFSLNATDARIKMLRIFIGPYIMSDRRYLQKFLERNKNTLSIAIYGSFASGEYGDRSDIDVLIITGDEKRPDTTDLAYAELKLGREIGITSIPFSKWREMERKKDNFFIAIRKNNIVIWGNAI